MTGPPRPVIPFAGARARPTSSALIQCVRRVASYVGRVGFALALLVAYYIGLIVPSTFRGHADDLGIAVHSHFNAVEAVVFTDLPNRWLQHAFLAIGPSRYISTYVYMSWFLLPVLAALPFVLHPRRDAWKLTCWLVIAYCLAMPFFALYPLQPPWLHDPRVQSVFLLVRPGLRGVDPNPYASMPSLHVAMPAVAALWYEGRHRYRIVLWAYTALISLTVVFSGDHYVADVVAGLLFAGAATFAMRRLRLPLRRRLDGLAPSTETAVDEAEQSAA